MKINEFYPEIEPYNTGMLKVSNIHTLYYEEVGNPKGKPIVFLHGGPGAGLCNDYRRYFDPEFYRVILFDQRGAGKSTPHAELRENTSWELVEDIEKIRKHLEIDKWIVFGGSWGSTLALLYAINHPDKTLALVLRGIFLGRKSEIDWIFQQGANMVFPEKWEVYYNLIPKEEQGNMIKAYYKRLTSDDEKTRMDAAKAWSVWEGSIVKLFPNEEETMDEFGDPHLALSMARTECHYFYNNMFYDSDNYIMENVDKIKNIPCRIVNGRYDMDCPVGTAWELHKALPKSEINIVKDAGHSGVETGTVSGLIQACEDFKNLYL